MKFPVDDLSDASPFDDDAWDNSGAQEASRLQRLMAQQAETLTVGQIASAAWRLHSLREWLQTISASNSNIATPTTTSTATAAAAGAAEKPSTTEHATDTTPESAVQTASVPSTSAPSFSILVEKLPLLLERLQNSSTEIHTLASKLEAEGSLESSSGEEEVPDELLAVIPLSPHPPRSANEKKEPQNKQDRAQPHSLPASAQDKKDKHDHDQTTTTTTEAAPTTTIAGASDATAEDGTTAAEQPVVPAAATDPHGINKPSSSDAAELTFVEPITAGMNNTPASLKTTNHTITKTSTQQALQAPEPIKTSALPAASAAPAMPAAQHHIVKAEERGDINQGTSTSPTAVATIPPSLGSAAAVPKPQEASPLAKSKQQDAKTSTKTAHPADEQRPVTLKIEDGGEEARKQRRRAAISWVPLPSHPEDKPLIRQEPASKAKAKGGREEKKEIEKEKEKVPLGDETRTQSRGAGRDGKDTTKLANKQKEKASEGAAVAVASGSKAAPSGATEKPSSRIKGDHGAGDASMPPPEPKRAKTKAAGEGAQHGGAGTSADADAQKQAKSAGKGGGDGSKHKDGKKSDSKRDIKTERALSRTPGSVLMMDLTNDTDQDEQGEEKKTPAELLQAALATAEAASNYLLRPVACLPPRWRPEGQRLRSVGAPPEERGWESVVESLDEITMNGSVEIRPIVDAPAGPPPGAQLGAWFDAIRSAPAEAPPPDEDIDPSARYLSPFFDTINPQITMYGVFSDSLTISFPSAFQEYVEIMRQLGVDVDVNTGGGGGGGRSQHQQHHSQHDDSLTMNALEFSNAEAAALTITIPAARGSSPGGTLTSDGSGSSGRDTPGSSQRAPLMVNPNGKRSHSPAARGGGGAGNGGSKRPSQSPAPRDLSAGPSGKRSRHEDQPNHHLNKQGGASDRGRSSRSEEDLRHQNNNKRGRRQSQSSSRSPSPSRGRGRSPDLRHNNNRDGKDRNQDGTKNRAQRGTSPSPSDPPSKRRKDQAPGNNQIVSLRLMNKFKNDRNRPTEPLDRLSPAQAIWRLEGSSAVTRSNVSYQDEFFDPTWRYETRVVVYLMKRRTNEDSLGNLMRQRPLPPEYYNNNDINTLLAFFTARQYMFEIIRDGRDHSKATIRLIKGVAGPFLEWKRRLMEYVAAAGRERAYRVPLAEALLASPFPRDTPNEELELARRNPWSYIIARIPDEVLLTAFNVWHPDSLRGSRGRIT